MQVRRTMMATVIFAFCGYGVVDSADALSIQNTETTGGRVINMLDASLNDNLSIGASGQPPPCGPGGGTVKCGQDIAIKAIDNENGTFDLLVYDALAEYVCIEPTCGTTEERARIEGGQLAGLSITNDVFHTFSIHHTGSAAAAGDIDIYVDGNFVPNPNNLPDGSWIDRDNIGFHPLGAFTIGNPSGIGFGFRDARLDNVTLYVDPDPSDLLNPDAATGTLTETVTRYEENFDGGVFQSPVPVDPGLCPSCGSRFQGSATNIAFDAAAGNITIDTVNQGVTDEGSFEAKVSDPNFLNLSQVSNFIIQFDLMVSDPDVGGLACDFNNDQACDDMDIDLLAAAVRNGTSDAQFNVDGIGGDVPDNDDFDYYITDDAFLSTGHGDGDLNMLVNFADFVLLSNDFGNSDTGWGKGNYNTDNNTNFNDFVLVSNNFGADFTSGANVPEPAAVGVLGALGIFVVRRRRA